MTVKEWIKGNDGNTPVFIGAASSYLVIVDGANKPKLMADLETESNRFRKSFNQRVANYERIIADNPRKIEEVDKLIFDAEVAQQAIWATENKPTFRYKEAELKVIELKSRRIGLVGELNRAKNSIPGLKKYLENWVDFQNRTVIDVYPKFSEPGVAVIISGKEVGNYWTLEEYEKRGRKK